eukprot:TRINITY_DN87030_c0_g1_i1.p3 TRINITY_DN87030_c0_g1~~TRINITY_DN87030_c0_g1_i1.p3  ORF type:complete len:117 (-),score=0.18 TRINITY_DN87030_c0_g1_i1:51-401(-)
MSPQINCFFQDVVIGLTNACCTQVCGFLLCLVIMRDKQKFEYDELLQRLQICYSFILTQYMIVSSAAKQQQGCYCLVHLIYSLCKATNNSNSVQFSILNKGGLSIFVCGTLYDNKD